MWLEFPVPKSWSHLLMAGTPSQVVAESSTLKQAWLVLPWSLSCRSGCTGLEAVTPAPRTPQQPTWASPLWVFKAHADSMDKQPRPVSYSDKGKEFVHCFTAKTESALFLLNTRFGNCHISTHLSSTLKVVFFYSTIIEIPMNQWTIFRSIFRTISKYMFLCHILTGNGWK